MAGQCAAFAASCTVVALLCSGAEVVQDSLDWKLAGYVRRVASSVVRLAFERPCGAACSGQPRRPVVCCVGCVWGGSWFVLRLQRARPAWRSICYSSSMQGWEYGIFTRRAAECVPCMAWSVLPVRFAGLRQALNGCCAHHFLWCRTAYCDSGWFAGLDSGCVAPGSLARPFCPSYLTPVFV